MDDNCRLDLVLVRPFGQRSTVVAVSLGAEFIRMPEKEEVSFLGFPVASFEDAVKILKKRQITGEVIRNAARQLGALLADRLEDEAGWHGEHRRELTKELKE